MTTQTEHATVPHAICNEDQTGLRLLRENEELTRRLEVTQARLDELLRSASIWRAWWNGKGGPQCANLAEKVDMIKRLENGSTQ